MKLNKNNAWLLILVFMTMACGQTTKEEQSNAEQSSEEFEYFSEQFADLKIIRYQIPGFDKLSTKQKELAYYLAQAGMEGRDIMWDMNYRHNLAIRKALENVIKNYQGDKTTADWENFIVYVKRLWFSNGIHHHYSNSKIMPEFSKDYLENLMAETSTQLDLEIVNILFDTEIDSKKVNRDATKGGLVKGSAVNFYAPDVTEAEVDAFYAAKTDEDPERPVWHGLNSQISKDENGNLVESFYKVDGLYGAAIAKIIGWLEKASSVAENEAQGKALDLLIEYYRTGSLETWDAYNLAWIEATEGDIDYINGFIEVYNDPKGYRGSFEAIVQIKDFEASATMKALADNVQWFEDNSTIMDEHKKDSVVGVTYKVVNVASESGDASPSTPIGVNLPNSDWIREIGSKSVSLGNIVSAYAQSGGSGILEEFAFNEEEVARTKEYGKLGDKLHTALHEVVGHASGKLNKGIGTPKETLKNYASALEEGRADLVALYFLMDEKLIELGLIPSLEVGREEYDSYIRNGLMTQLRRLELGDNVEESHMVNRQMIAKWAYEKGQKENVIERKEKGGKTYFVINDYQKLRQLFGELLKEIQRIKSEGDYNAGMNLIENYGVKVDQEIHAEVLERSEKFKSAPYGGFINPLLIPVTDTDGNITDVKVEYPSDFTAQMLMYSETYGNL